MHIFGAHFVFKTPTKVKADFGVKLTDPMGKVVFGILQTRARKLAAEQAEIRDEYEEAGASADAHFNADRAVLSIQRDLYQALRQML